MGWKHKKQSKWLTRGGRKVRCYLCGKRILNRDLFLFHAETGYYSHQSCFTESKTMGGNERRKAVKKIAVGAVLATAIAAGAGKFIDISSQSKGSNSPDTQTILTSQGLILPALTSDPSNPVPGQMWYRSDAGVEAHFDGVQNRVVYSSEINDGNVNVTSKGIINGLSVLPNDGKGGFGPDTTKGATALGQYGSPYTQTTGIQEAINYSIISGNYQFAQPVKISAGNYPIHSPIKVIYYTPPTNNPGNDGATPAESVAMPIITGAGNQPFNALAQSGTRIYAASDFPTGEDMLVMFGAYEQQSESYVSLTGLVMENILFDCQSIAAGLSFVATQGAIFRNIGVRVPAVFSGTETLYDSTYGSGVIQTGGFNAATTGTTGEWQTWENIQVRTAAEDGIVIQTNEQIIGINLWAANSTRYGFYLKSTGDNTGVTLINPQMETAGGWTGSVPSYGGADYPAAASLVIDNTQYSYGAGNMWLTIINAGYFDLLPDNGVAVFSPTYAGATFIGGSLPVRPSSSTSTYPIIAVTAGNTNTSTTTIGSNLIFRDMSFQINSTYYPLFRTWAYVTSGTEPQSYWGQFIFENCFIYDLNTSSTFVSVINTSSMFATSGAGAGFSSPTFAVNMIRCWSSNPNYSLSGITGLTTAPSVPASGTAQQNTNPYAVDVYIYGGDVTEIQITRNGTAYTVLSVSTAIAMSGQAYKLNPGDSITVTYSTAPTWEWLSD